MEILRRELGLTTDFEPTLRIAVRLLVAMLLAALVGMDRELRHRSAGLRTHMLVGLGSALFTAVPSLASGDDADVLAQLVKGIAAGIGFLGAGAILKSQEDKERVHGLTTAASIWLTAAVGMAAGAGKARSAALAAVLTWIVLAVLYRVERLLGRKPTPRDADLPKGD